MIRTCAICKIGANSFEWWFKRSQLAHEWRRDYGKMLPGEWFLATMNGTIERVTITRVSPLGYYECTTCDGGEYIVNCPGINPEDVL